MMSLSKQEKYYLKLFLEDNLDWIKVNSMTKEENLYSLINMYGAFLEDNHLGYARNLQMFLVVLHQEATKAKLNKYSVRLQNLNTNTVPFNTRISNNPSINAWIEAADIGINKEKEEDAVDYDLLNQKIMKQREKQLLKIRKQNDTK